MATAGSGVAVDRAHRVRARRDGTQVEHVHVDVAAHPDVDLVVVTEDVVAETVVPAPSKTRELRRGRVVVAQVLLATSHSSLGWSRSYSVTARMGMSKPVDSANTLTRRVPGGGFGVM